MLNYPCRILLIEDEIEDIKIVKAMLSNVRSAFFKEGLEVTSAKTLAQAQQMLSESKFDVILLDLVLPDSRNMDSLEKLQTQNMGAPIIVQTALEDEVVAVKALELGACGYLPKVASDRSLLLYALRSAIERKQQLAELEPSQQQQQELDTLDGLIENDLETKTNKTLKLKMPDVFSELQERYNRLLISFVEQKIYRVENDLGNKAKVLIEQLGYLQATPQDLIELHTTSLKKSPPQKNKAYLAEGRYLLLELMGRLVAYYRRYYIGLNKISASEDWVEFERQQR